MDITPPQPGQVLCYAYLWADEAERGQEEGLKDRPVALILALQPQGQDRPRVVALPITHAAPSDPANAVLLPAATKARLGLDEEQSWVILTECNVFSWPGPDLRSVPRSNPPTNLYGELPAALFYQIRERFLALYNASSIRPITRTE